MTSTSCPEEKVSLRARGLGLQCPRAAVLPAFFLLRSVSPEAAMCEDVSWFPSCVRGAGPSQGGLLEAGGKILQVPPVVCTYTMSADTSCAVTGAGGCDPQKLRGPLLFPEEDKRLGEGQQTLPCPHTDCSLH